MEGLRRTRSIYVFFKHTCVVRAECARIASSVSYQVLERVLEPSRGLRKGFNTCLLNNLIVVI